MEKKDHQKPKNQELDRLAPGLDGVEGLEEEASSEEIAKGDSTTVTKLVWDEYEPSE
ncbi:hypothetical protein [Sulfoacidibacillus thermotolerans]|uniref:hypothetical protein n=1 Tax=Sulfoacidibacillus thermotolerans TaxID=1765684 RepID=UPI0015E80C10|nr:hypothetical protein [Sulfoacidibacillus thermotolerans]